MEWIADPQAWIALGTLTVLEIVLGIDNLVVISILSDKLPEHQQKRARLIGLALAMGARIALLFSLAWLMQLTAPLFEVLNNEISGQDLVLLGGGLFLLGKSTHEIHDKLEGAEKAAAAAGTATMAGVLTQIVIMDFVFSVDSVVTAIGMADDIAVMVIAVVIAVIIMMVSVNTISEFVQRHPTVKMLALSFLLLIGMLLVAEGLGQHIPKGYVYFAMAFSVFVEMVNLRVRATGEEEPVRLHDPRLARAVERATIDSSGARLERRDVS